jgi:hypothetical protein
MLHKSFYKSHSRTKLGSHPNKQGCRAICQALSTFPQRSATAAKYIADPHFMRGASRTCFCSLNPLRVTRRRNIDPVLLGVAWLRWGKAIVSCDIEQLLKQELWSSAFHLSISNRFEVVFQYRVCISMLKCSVLILRGMNSSVPL